MIRLAPFRLVRTVRQGELLPRGYGFAWALWYADQCVALPIPLNVIAGAARAVWLWFKRGGVPLHFRNAGEAFNAGFEAGIRVGVARETGVVVMEDRHGT